MGNNACCVNTIVVDQIDFTQEISKPQHLPFPFEQLAQPLQQKFNEIKPFHHELQKDQLVLRYGDDLYSGQLDQEKRPSGIGKMLRSNGQLFVGNFKQGKANGQGYFFLPDGTYYQGIFKNNMASDPNGKVIFPNNMVLKGNFTDNNINGHGIQQGKNYKFQGEYEKGKKIKGQLYWETHGQSFEYDGYFDQNSLFTGYGFLKEPRGTYQGQFKNGKKEGKGIYKYANKLTYIGTYVNGIKEGQGTMYQEDGQMEYSGEWKNGLPHGKGYSIGLEGEATQSSFVEGIETRLLTSVEMMQ